LSTTATLLDISVDKNIRGMCGLCGKKSMRWSKWSHVELWHKNHRCTNHALEHKKNHPAHQERGGFFVKKFI